jgi:hypothetical protein
MKIQGVTKETILINAHRLLFENYAETPLWAFISDVCAVGSTLAIEICKEMGWNPHQDGSIRLERKNHVEEYVKCDNVFCANINLVAVGETCPVCEKEAYR